MIKRKVMVKKMEEMVMKKRMMMKKKVKKMRIFWICHHLGPQSCLLIRINSWIYVLTVKRQYFTKNVK
jgi:hypothetical protein